MHIAIEALSLGTRNSGIGVCTANLLTGLAQLDCTDRLTVYVSDFEGALEIARPASAELVTVPASSGNRLVRTAWRQLCLDRDMRRRDVDVLHGTAYVLPGNTPVPSVVTVHDLIALTHPQLCPTWNAWHVRSLLPRTVRRARRIVVHSRATADGLMRMLSVPAGKIVVLRPGIADVFFKRVLKARRQSVALRYSLPVRYVLFAGNLDPKKDIETLLSAFQGLLRRGYPGKLVITGPTGWKDRTLRGKLAQLKHSVCMTGYVQSEDMPALYAGADVAVLASLVEGFGLPVVEAMAVGTPVVTSDVPGLVEAAGDAALKVKAGNAVGLTDALGRIIDGKKLRNDLKKRGRKHAKGFRSSAYAQAHLELYHELR